MTQGGGTGNESTVTQDAGSEQNDTTIVQNGSGNISNVDQNGDRSFAAGRATIFVDQIGSANESDVGQAGDGPAVFRQ